MIPLSFSHAFKWYILNLFFFTKCYHIFYSHQGTSICLKIMKLIIFRQHLPFDFIQLPSIMQILILYFYRKGMKKYLRKTPDGHSIGCFHTILFSSLELKCRLLILLKQNSRSLSLRLHYLLWSYGLSKVWPLWSKDIYIRPFVWWCHGHSEKISCPTKRCFSVIIQIWARC